MYSENADRSWNTVNTTRITNSTVWASYSIAFNGLIVGETYHLFIFYSDGWTDDYNQKIYLRNINLNLESSSPVYLTSDISFLGLFISLGILVIFRRRLK